jgi:hypothetical protein
MDLGEIGCGGVAQDRDQWWAVVSGVMNLRFWRHRVGWLVILYVGNGTVSGVGGTTYHIRQCL